MADPHCPLSDMGQTGLLFRIICLKRRNSSSVQLEMEGKNDSDSMHLGLYVWLLQEGSQRSSPPVFVSLIFVKYL